MVINHLLNGMILQVGHPYNRKKASGLHPRKPTAAYPTWWALENFGAKSPTKVAGVGCSGAPRVSSMVWKRWTSLKIWPFLVQYLCSISGVYINKSTKNEASNCAFVRILGFCDVFLLVEFFGRFSRWFPGSAHDSYPHLSVDATGQKDVETGDLWRMATLNPSHEILIGSDTGILKFHSFWNYSFIFSLDYISSPKKESK